MRTVRWDAARKLWYIKDVADLKPFMRWIPDLEAASEPSSSAKAPAKQAPGVITKSAVAVPDCGCQVLPWVNCEHDATQTTP